MASEDFKYKKKRNESDGEFERKELYMFPSGVGERNKDLTAEN